MQSNPIPPQNPTNADGVSTFCQHICGKLKCLMCAAWTRLATAMIDEPDPSKGHPPFPFSHFPLSTPLFHPMENALRGCCKNALLRKRYFYNFVAHKFSLSQSKRCTSTAAHRFRNLPWGRSEHWISPKRKKYSRTMFLNWEHLFLKTE